MIKRKSCTHPPLTTLSYLTFPSSHFFPLLNCVDSLTLHYFPIVYLIKSKTNKKIFHLYFASLNKTVQRNQVFCSSNFVGFAHFLRPFSGDTADIFSAVIFRWKAIWSRPSPAFPAPPQTNPCWQFSTSTPISWQENVA